MNFAHLCYFWWVAKAGGAVRARNCTSRWRSASRQAVAPATASTCVRIPCTKRAATAGG